MNEKIINITIPVTRFCLRTTISAILPEALIEFCRIRYHFNSLISDMARNITFLFALIIILFIEIIVLRFYEYLVV